MSSEQERLAHLIWMTETRDLGGVTQRDADTLAAAILDSDVIREIKGEAWDEGWLARHQVRGANPYIREATDAQQ